MPSALTAERLRELLHYEPDTGVFTWRVSPSYRCPVGSEAGTRNSKYVQISIDGKLYYAHRLAWLYVHGEWPRNKIDHHDQCKKNNCIKNIRDVTTRVNNENSSRVNRTGHRGVFVGKAPGTFYAQIYRNKRLNHLGVFTSIEAAQAAYKQAKAAL